MQIAWKNLSIASLNGSFRKGQVSRALKFTVSLMGAQRICKIQALISHLKHKEPFSNLLYGHNIRALCWKYTEALSRS